MESICSNFRSLFEGGDSDNRGSGGGWQGFYQAYGWYATIEWVARETPGMNEDLICDWTAIRFLNRVQFLKHRDEIRQFEQRGH